VIVVEHDEEAIREADYVFDIGPGAGVHGGQVVATARRIRSPPIPPRSPGNTCPGARNRRARRAAQGQRQEVKVVKARATTSRT
jgi:excinuclease ABC subunit A